MRVLATCIVALGLVVSPALAGAAAPGDKDNPAANSNTTAGTQPATAPSAVAKVDPAAKPEPSSSEVAAELQQLRDLLEAQSKQLQEQQQKMQLLEEQLNASSAARENIVASPGAADPSAIGPVAGVAANTSVANAGSNQEKTGPPTSIQFKGITLTPGGFMAAETVWRQKGLASDVNTPFNNTPFNGSSNAHMSEFNASGRQSRISMLVEGKLDSVKIGGYYEMDFLSAGVTSNPNQSNSYTMRQRQFWAQAAFNNGITVTGGQQWSLLTETTHGMDNRSEALPQTIDAQYHVGFSWARQEGIRFTKDFGDKVWLGFSIEEPQDTITVHGNPTAVSGGTVITEPATTCATPPCTVTVNTVTNNNFLLGAFGATGGLNNPIGNYPYNPSPDFIVKAVFEPGFGHYEIFGVLSDFRDRVFPCVPLTGTTAPAGCSSITSAAGAFNDSRQGGGIGANARWNLFAKKVDLGIHFFGGDGIGRYGSGGLSDATVRPDGTLAPIHNFQSLGTLQFHPTPKLDINLNAGGEFEERTNFTKPGGAAPNDGYGYALLNNSGCWTETLPIAAPGTGNNLGVPTGVGGATGFIPGALANCTGDTRNLIEGSIGFWYRFYKGPKGTVQFGMQYANYVRNTWRGTGTAGTVSASGQPHSDENMVFTSFRYYLP
ncbi:MAG TPA: hypothetical protein VNV41_18955 [Candidatus Acidoferrales bacterium]|nr:hypothetical protein [Candidatus Acidoferrales bacterium]